MQKREVLSLGAQPGLSTYLNRFITLHHRIHNLRYRLASVCGLVGA